MFFTGGWERLTELYHRVTRDEGTGTNSSQHSNINVNMKFENKIKHRRITQNQLITINLRKKSKYIVKYDTHRVKERDS